MTKENCGCKEGNSCEQKVCLKHLLEPVYDTLPDNIKEMMHSLDKQKLAVMTELKGWADKNGHQDISDLCQHKIDKVNKRLSENQ